MTASALTRPGQRERLSSKLVEIDWRLVGLIGVIAGSGIAMLYSIAGGSWTPWALNQLIRFTGMVFVMVALALVNPRWWFRAAYPLYGVLLVLVLMIEFTPLGYTAGGAKNWLNLGFTRIQPAEFVKLGLVLALARWYHNHSAEEARWHWKLVIPAAMIGVPFILVAKQPDLGSAMIIGLTGATVMFMAGLSWRIIGILAAAAAVVVPPFVMFGMHDYQRNRVLTFLSPESDPSGTGYNIIQSKIALGSGGFWGKGFLNGSQAQLSFLPEKQTDFAFTMLAEEAGFVGALTVLVLFLAVLLLGLLIAARCASHFGRLVAAGAVVNLFIYVAINVSMVTGLIPVVGVPLPLISYGGTAMLTLVVSLGLLLCADVHRHLVIPRYAEDR